MKTASRIPRGLVGLLTLATVAAVALPLAGVAVANHGNATLEVTPEIQNLTTGQPATMTATISIAASDGPVNIDFEHYAGNNNSDGSTHGSPDLSCDIPVGQKTCSVSYTGTNAANGTGRDRWRAWIDHDKVQTTVEADIEEGEEASQAECFERNNTTSESTCPPDPSNNVVYVGGTAGTSCPGRGNPGNEPDCTDVVTVNYTNPTGVATTLDCDDSGGADRERETNPGSTDDAVSAERYRCTVRNQFGGTMSGQKVFAEIENNVNDPDPVDGPSYDSPDQQCESPAGQTGRDPDAPPPPFAADNVCYITIEQSEGELGTAEICFWTGEIADGAALCADEPTGENQAPDGSDTGNDKADQVELTWQNVETFTLDCNPETDVNPAGQSHTVTCAAKDPINNRNVSGVNVDAEITGAGDPDMENSPLSPDRTCNTGADGTCSFSHTSTTSGTTTYRAWIDDGSAEPRFDDGTDEDIDRTEGRDESATPGEYAEPDNNDVVQKTWTPTPTSLVMVPANDTGNVGECNPFTITVTAGSGQSATPVEGAVIDVEQVHAKAAGQNDAPGDEPTVDFCVPPSGPNPSDVDTTKGDLGPDSAQQNDRENPDNKGTAGGETTKATDASGQITIGIEVEPGQGSDGSGNVTVTAFFDSDGDDDPDASEPQDASIKTWQDPSAADARTIDCSPETAGAQAGSQHTIDCIVRNRSGQPVQGEGVTFTESGPGTFVGPTQSTTDASGEVSATVTSTETGTQTVTGTLDDDTGAGEPTDEDECDRAANDPTGAPAGVCEDSVTVTWAEDPPSECDDGIDNDGDGRVDFPADPGCEDADDNDEGDERCPGFESDPRNHIVGTPGNDTLIGTSGDDIICGGGGDDTIEGGGGDDLILGGDGNDDLRGDDGNDEIRGEGGKDAIRGNAGDDDLRGGDQNDIILGNAGDDLMSGNKGEDILRGGADDDTAQGGADDDTIQGGRGADTLKGGKGKDTLRGKQDDDTIKGGGGDDVLRGGSGDDKLNGGKGTDTCAGGPGNDKRFNCEG